MPTNFLTAPFGGASTKKYNAGGIAELYLLEFSQLLSTEDVLGDMGYVKSVTGMTLASGATFSQIGFIENTASYSDPLTRGTTAAFMKIALQFQVNASGSEAIDFADKINLNTHVALVKTKKNKWFLLGKDYGLTTTESSASSGAKAEDDSALSFTLGGTNLGYACEVNLAAIELASSITKITA